jgi:hypothetical protein
VDELDEYGFPAYTCSADRGVMQPIPEAPGAFACGTCGHRTDQPGTGRLGDGFDVIHRRWGLRGDPHVWQILRDRLAETPTPEGHDAVRAAYVAAFNEVAGVDVDAEPEMHVFRKELDHGGMSGGVIDLEWWRTKGLPLLVERACC